MSAEKKMSRRQELLAFVATGRLRTCLFDARLSGEATDLAVDVILRYCEPRQRTGHDLREASR